MTRFTGSIDVVCEDGGHDVHFDGTFVDENGGGACDGEALAAAAAARVVEKMPGEPPAAPVIGVSQVLL